MPGYLDNSNITPNSDDVNMVGRHLTGEQRLSGDALVRADLDRDGMVTAADLLLMLRLAHGQAALPLSPPFVDWAEPPILAPGHELTIVGANFGVSLNTIQVQLSNHEADITIPVASVTDERIVLQIPANAPRSEPDRPGYLRILKEGILSNPASLVVTDGPVLEDIRPAISIPGEILQLAGYGFGSNPADQVWIGNSAVTPLNRTPTLITVRTPATLSEALLVMVEAGGRRSNEVPLTPRADLTGLVSLPAGSPLLLDQLSVFTAVYNSAPISATGRFSLATGFESPLLVEVQDSQGQVILGAAALDPAASISITSASTALWVLYYLSHPALAPQDTLDLIAAIERSGEVGAIAILIETNHASQPALMELVESNQPLRTAIAAGLSFVDEFIHARTGSGA